MSRLRSASRAVVGAWLGAVVTLSSTRCGPSADDYPLLRPDAGYPDAALLDELDEEGPDNFIEDDPLEDWDTTDAGPLSGIFAVEVVVPAKVVVDLEARQLLRFRILQKGAEVRIRTQMCRIGLPSVPGVAELEIPLVLEKLIRTKDSESEGTFLSASEPLGATLTPPETQVLIGAELQSPTSDPLPTADNPAAAIDEDADGQPGVTLRASTVLCDVKQSAYVALRVGVSISGKVETLDRITGAVTPVLDQSVLGFSDPCMAAAADLPIDIVPGSRFLALRTHDTMDVNGNGNITCGEIVAAAPELFGDYWAPAP